MDAPPQPQSGASTTQDAWPPSSRGDYHEGQHANPAQRRPPRPSATPTSGDAVDSSDAPQASTNQAPNDANAASDDDSVGKRIRTFLGEFRMIIPAMAALFGFQLTVAFQDSFVELARVDRAVNFVGLVCTAIAFLFLLVPASYHRFLAHQEDTEEFLLFARRSIHLAFLFIPVAIALSLYMQALRSFDSRPAAAATSAAFLGLLIVAWWIYPKQRARQSGHAADTDDATHGRLPSREDT